MFSGILGLLSYLASAIGLASQVDKSNKATAESNRQWRYNERVKQYELEQQKAAEKEARRNALARAIGYDLPFMPQPSEEPPKQPKPADLSGYDVATGISNLASSGLKGLSSTDIVQGMDANYGAGNDLINAGTDTSDLYGVGPQNTAPIYTQPDSTLGTGQMGDPLATNKYGSYLSKFRYS